MELLARVNDPIDAPSGSHQQHYEGGRDSWIGEQKDHGKLLGILLQKKEKNVFRIGFQNIGGFTEGNPRKVL
jgi:hypothetical protein